MIATVAWEREEAPGWTAAYRIVAGYAWLPTRIEGRWRWRVPYYALQVMYAEEQPPTAWLTVERALDPTPLVLHRHVVVPTAELTEP